MTVLNFNSRELKTRRFHLLTRKLGGREDVALGVLAHLWMRCLETKHPGFGAPDRLDYIAGPLDQVDVVLDGLMAAGYLKLTFDCYRVVDVEPWVLRAHVRLERARKAGEKSVKARAKKKAAKARADKQALALAAPNETALAQATRACWDAYSERFFALFHVKPVRNVKVNSLIKQFCQRVPKEDAPHVLRFFVGHGHSFYAQRMYPLDMAVKDAESLYAQWQTGQPITRVTMEQFDQRQKTRAALEEGISF